MLQLCLDFKPNILENPIIKTIKKLFNIAILFIVKIFTDDNRIITGLTSSIIFMFSLISKGVINELKINIISTGSNKNLKIMKNQGNCYVDLDFKFTKLKKYWAKKVLKI